MTTVSVRYIVHDVDQAIAFYRDALGFKVEMHPNPLFAMLSLGDLRLILNRPGGGPGGGQQLADGRMPEPGGWNRIQLPVPDLDAAVADLRRRDVPFRTDVIVGVGVKQVIVEDPSGNPVELAEPLPRGS